MAPFILSKKDTEEWKQGLELADTMKPRMHSGCGWA